jgi:hypothetical protein
VQEGFYPLPSSPGGPRTPQGGGGVPQRSTRTYDIHPAPVHRAYPPADVRTGYTWQPAADLESEDPADQPFDDIGSDLAPDAADVPENIMGGDIDTDAVGDGDGPHDADTVDTSDGCDDCADAGDTADNSIT